MAEKRENSTGIDRNEAIKQRWVSQLSQIDAPGDWKFESHFPEAKTAGLIIWDASGMAHHFRLWCTDWSIEFINVPEDPDESIPVHPGIQGPLDKTLYDTDGIPPAVSKRLKQLEVTPCWEDACDPGNHSFDVRVRLEPMIYCTKCKNSKAVLSWLGHHVPVSKVEV